MKNIMNNTVRKQKSVTNHRTNKNKRRKIISDTNVSQVSDDHLLENPLNHRTTRSPENILAKMNKINNRRKNISTHLHSFVPKDIADLIAEYDYYIEGVSHNFRRNMTCEAILSDGRVIGKSLGVLKILNIKTGKIDTTFRCHTGEIKSIAMHPDGRIVSCAVNDTMIKIWNPLTKKCEVELNNHNNPSCVAVLPNGNVVCGSYKTLTIWNQETEKNYVIHHRSPQLLTPHDDWISCITTLSNRRFASGSYDSTITVWNFDNNDMIACLHLRGHTAGVICLATLPDGRIVSGSTDFTLKIWNTLTGTNDITLVGHTDIVSCVTVLPDGRIASGSMDRTIKIWNPKTGKCHVTFYNNDKVYNIMTYYDGRIISQTIFDMFDSIYFSHQSIFDVMKIWS